MPYIYIYIYKVDFSVERLLVAFVMNAQRLDNLRMLIYLICELAKITYYPHLLSCLFEHS